MKQPIKRVSKGSRFRLGEPWQSDLIDFCAANYNAPETEIIRHALKAFISDRLNAEPEVRKRCEEARKKRLGANGDKIRVLPTGK
jgi:hypothetical protein